MTAFIPTAKAGGLSAVSPVNELFDRANTEWEKIKKNC